MDGGILETIARIESDLLEVRSSPQRVGTSSITGKITQSIAWSGVLPNYPGYVTLQLTATGPIGQPLLGEFIPQLFVSTLTNEYTPRDAYLSTGATYVMRLGLPQIRYETSNIVTQRVELQGDGVTVCRIAAAFLGSDDVTITAGLV